MSEKRPTVYDVAALAGVSIATVSHSFRRPDRIREETRETVLKAARELGYVPSGSARSLAGGSTGALGLHLFHLLLPLQQSSTTDRPVERSLLESIVKAGEGDAEPAWYPEANTTDHDPTYFPLYVDEIQRGFVIECRDRDRPVILSHGGTEQSEVASTAGRVDGLAVFPGRSNVQDVLEIMGDRPLVFFSARPHPRHAQVNSDNRGGMRSVVEHLATVHSVREFGWVGETSGQFDFAERFEAFAEAVLAVPGSSMRIIDEHNLDLDPTLPGVTAAASAKSLPQALVCSNDQTAIIVMKLLASAGVRVPNDVLVTGFDDVLAAELTTPALTTVRQQFELMGRVAAHILMSEANHKPTVTLGVSLIARGSCGC